MKFEFYKLSTFKYSNYIRNSENAQKAIRNHEI